jgi:predicted transcriptional regulator
MLIFMTKILEMAIEKARSLPPEEQDVIGAVLLALTEEEWTRIGELDAETRAAIREGLEQAERGEFVPDDEIEALWVRLGL